MGREGRNIKQLVAHYKLGFRLLTAKNQTVNSAFYWVIEDDNPECSLNSNQFLFSLPFQQKYILYITYNIIYYNNSYYYLKLTNDNDSNNIGVGKLRSLWRPLWHVLYQYNNNSYKCYY